MKLTATRSLTAIIFLTAIVMLPAAAGINGLDAGQKITMHFFSSGVCPSCKKAEKDMPEIRIQFPALAVVKYEVRNSQGVITAENNRNIQKLIAMLREMDRTGKGAPFIYEGTTAYSFVLENGVPCYRKKISAGTTLTKEIPVPVFILGGKVFLGYQRHLLQRELARLSGGK